MLEHPNRGRLRLRRWAGATALVLAASTGLAGGARVPARAQEPPADSTPHSEARLVARLDALRPGEPLPVGVLVRLDPGWHTYWRNPGDSGTEALLDWSLPAGFTAGPILWPLPHRIPYPPLMSYGYEGEVLLVVDLAAPADLRPGSVRHLAVDAAWLVCQEECLPAEAHLTLDLPVSDAPPARSAWAAAFDAASRALPAEADGWGLRAWSEGDELVLGTRPRSDETGLHGPYFFAYDPRLLDHAAPQEVETVAGETRLRLRRSPYHPGAVDSLRGVLAWQDDDGEGAAPGGVRVSVAVSPSQPDVVVADAAAAGTDPASGLALLAALGFAFLGGILLNLMPCVFPVLSLKVLGFLEHAGGARDRARTHGLAFSAGVLVCALALGGLLLAVRAAGAEVGWGFQLQSPVVVTVLALLMVAIGLDLLGVFEVGASLTRLGAVGAHSASYRGSFLTGALAMVVATPCTAPFMGAAVGAALVRPAAEGLAIFGALGAGMATPYLVLSFQPQLLDRLPRPGPWMVTLRQGLAFPMLAVAAWLLWVLGLQAGAGTMARVLAGMLGLAFGGWLLGKTSASASRGRGARLGRGTAILVLLVSVLWSAQSAARGGAASPSATSTAEGGAWQPFTAGVVEDARAGGSAVFVDFTAAWCITCQVNERVVLARDDVLAAFRERGVRLVRADWTRRDPDITRALAAFGRSGVPLYVLYPPDGADRPRLLPTVLTPDLVLEALEALDDPGQVSGEPTDQEAS